MRFLGLKAIDWGVSKASKEWLFMTGQNQYMELDKLDQGLGFRV